MIKIIVDLIFGLSLLASFGYSIWNVVNSRFALKAIITAYALIGSIIVIGNWVETLLI